MKRLASHAGMIGLVSLCTGAASAGVIDPALADALGPRVPFSFRFVLAARSTSLT